MNLQLPPERDLPAHVLREIEAELTTVVTERRRPRWLVPVAAAAAVVVLFGVVVGVLRGADEDRVRPSTPTSSAPSLPLGDPDRIVRECAKAYGDGLPGPVDPADAKVYNSVGTLTDGVALIYSDEAVLVCRLGDGRGGTRYNPGGGGILAPHLVTAPYQLDYQSAAGLGSDDGTRRSEVLLGGRTTPDVARLTATVGGRTAVIAVRDQTFVAALTFDADLTADLVLRAYDANGNALSEPPAPYCLTTPDGKRLGAAPPSGEQCAPTVAWP